MIVEWLVALGAGIAETIAGLFPDWNLPEWFTDPSGQAAQLLQFIAGMGVWVPLPLMTGVVSAVFVSWAVTAGVRLVRAVAAHIPQFGGGGA